MTTLEHSSGIGVCSVIDGYRLPRYL